MANVLPARHCRKIFAHGNGVQQRFASQNRKIKTIFYSPLTHIHTNTIFSWNCQRVAHNLFSIRLYYIRLH